MDRRPEDFLEMVARARRGRLKLYLGFAAGVGKTYRMLEEAHALQRRGVEVVIGVIETHQRAETEALRAGLPFIPPKRLSYRGVEIEELDLEGVLARKPQIVLIDELPHTNAPTSKNAKRYQDVLDILAAGINVIAAMNVQHIESLNDLVARVTGVVVRETIPDTFLKQADQVVTLDLDVHDLLERLQAGKIYAKEKVDQAREHFFTPENLGALRELALREVAERLDRNRSHHLGDDAAKQRASRSRVMVCISSYSPRAAALLRRGSRTAGRLDTSWFVVYVETPTEAPTRIDAEAQRNLLDNIQKAKELGAEVVQLKSNDPVTALLDFARSHNVGHLIVGRSHQPWYKRLLGRGFMERMVQSAVNLDLHIVSTNKEPD